MKKKPIVVVDLPTDAAKLEVVFKIRQRRSQMMVHSAIYYDLNDNIVSDDQWQKWAEELATLQNDHPDCCKIGYFDTDFEDWDGTTGAMLQYRHPLVYPKAVWLLNYHKNQV